MTAKPRISIKHNKVTNSWADALDALTINDDHWWCTITMMVESSPSHIRIVELFDEIADERSRKAIYPITLNDIMSSVQAFSKIDPGKCPPVQRVFHHVNRMMEQGGNIDAWLMIRLIKYTIYQAKMESIAMIRRETESESDVDRNIRAMLTVSNVDSQRSVKSMKSKNSKKSLDISVVPETNSHSQKHRESQRNTVYIDDAPPNGPNLFIILTGFRDPNIPLELVKAGLPLTCILKINYPRSSIDTENLKRDLEERDDVSGPPKSDNSRYLMENTLSQFWSGLEKSANNRYTRDVYSGIAFQTFCPSHISLYGDPEDVKKSKKELYDRVSFIVYDLYDLQRLHADYIRSMKLQEVPLRPKKEFNVYTEIMDQVPAECSLVSIILQAMLAQVEDDIQSEESSNSETAKSTSLENDAYGGSVVLSEVDEHSSFEDGSSNDVNRRSSFHSSDHLSYQSNNDRPMLRQFSVNRQINAKESTPTPNMSPKVILECDMLRLVTYHVPVKDAIVKFINPEPLSLADLAQRSFKDPRLIDIWINRDVVPEQALEKYRNHVKKMALCFNVPIDCKRLVHYLHLQTFDKMIHGQLNGMSAGYEDHDVLITKKDAVLLATRSDLFPLSSKTIQVDRTLAAGGNPIFNLRSFRSDSIIDYHIPQDNIIEYPKMLPASRDSHEISGEHDNSPKSWYQKFTEREADNSYLHEFIDVQVLSKNILPQVIHECFWTYRGFQSRYSDITDSMLLCFGDCNSSQKLPDVKSNEDERVSQYDNPINQISFIVTPVSFRYFCKYVIHEIKDFIRDIETARSAKMSMSAGNLTRKLSCHSNFGILDEISFTENDFILPNSLKDQARQQKYIIDSSEEPDTTPKTIDLHTTKIQKNDKEKAKSTLNSSSKEKSLTSIRNGNGHHNSMIVRKIPSLRCARDDEPYKFIGYDLGNSRVQITSRNELFTSQDGTRVKVDLEEWLHEEKRLEIGIELLGCFLKLQRTIGDLEDSKMPFHLITENGIVMTFLKVHESKVAESSNPEEAQSFLPFEFRISWPSSLLVEPVKGDSYENPFYIQQRYISRGPECGNVLRENYRKFLRNGTVLKFLESNVVEVLRPNGTIVQCLEYDKIITDSDTETYSNLGKGIYSSEDDAARVKIIRYTVIEADGRRFEVENDEISCIYDRFFVRTSIDVELGEKFTRRDDGTKSLLNSKGELFVSFPDGTRIITGYVIENEPLCCDWSDDEFTTFFGRELNSNPRRQPSNKASTLSWSDSDQLEFGQRSNGDDKRAILLSNAFVSVLMTCRMEHCCYATVTYEPTKNSCLLSMPDEVEMQITREGLFEISIGQKIDLLVKLDELTFSAQLGDSGRSISIYNLRETKSSVESSENEETLLNTTDSNGQVFKVNVDGSVSRNIGSSFNIKNNNHRLFAVNRDFTGVEYIHKSQREKYQKKINLEEKSVSIFIPMGSHGLPEYQLFLNPLEPTNYSKKWLQKVSKIRQIDYAENNLLRSTYAKPYNWLFPFGRPERSVEQSTRKVYESILENNSQVLTLTILERIANEGDCFLKELKKAMACYHHEPQDILYAHRPLRNGTLVTNTKEQQIEQWLNDISLQVETNIDTKGYLRRLLKEQMDDKSTRAQKFPKRRKSTRLDSLQMEDIQWYEHCIGERIILPYFKNIQGSCFLWIISCVDRALQLVE